MACDTGTTDRLIAMRARAIGRLSVFMLLSVVLPLVGTVAIGTLLAPRAFADAAQRLGRAARIAQEHAIKLLNTNQMLLRLVPGAQGWGHTSRRK